MEQGDSIITLFCRDFVGPLLRAYDNLSRALLALALFISFIVFIDCVVAPRAVSSSAVVEHPYALMAILAFLVFASQMAPLFTMYRAGVRSAIIIIIIVAAVDIAVLAAILATYVAKVVPDERSVVVMVGGLSAFAVSASLLIQALSASHAARRTHTFNVLMQSRTSEEFQRHVRGRDPYYSAGKQAREHDYQFYWTQRRFEEYELKERARIATLQEKCSYSAASKRFGDRLEARFVIARAKHQSMISLKYMLNFYEFVCGGIIARDLDRDLIEITVKDIMIGLYRDTAELRACARLHDGERVFENLRYMVGGIWGQDAALADKTPLAEQVAGVRPLV